MTNDIPNEQGWYWAQTHSDEWFMCFVNTAKDLVYLWNGDDPHFSARVLFRIGGCNHIRRWFGPFNCPGGPFADRTIVFSAEDHDIAEENGTALVVKSVCLKHCRDDGFKGTVTMFDHAEREEALRRFYGMRGIEPRQKGSGQHDV